MKDFRKTKDGLFICEECNKTYKDKKNGLCHHIYKNHNPKEYFDKWLKEEGDNICKVCGNEINFISLSHGYNNRCSKTCKNLYRAMNVKISVFNLYGVENVFQLNNVKEKRNNTMKIKYGTEQASNSEILKEKRKQTFIKKYGVSSYVLSSEFKEKRKQTNLKKYGCENNSQNKDQYEKMQKSGYKLKPFRDTDLWYQGTYELDFLEKYYDKFPDIQRGPSIKYVSEDEEHWYHPDFYIPSINLIIECKNSWLEKRDKKQIKKKSDAVSLEGFKYCIIIDKNYNDFNIISSL